MKAIFGTSDGSQWVQEDTQQDPGNKGLFVEMGYGAPSVPAERYGRQGGRTYDVNPNHIVWIRYEENDE